MQAEKRYFMEKFISSMKYFGLGLQLVFAVALPFGVCIFAAGFLKEKFGLDDWIFLIFILLALFWAAADVFAFAKNILKDISKNNTVKGENPDGQRDKE
jgi:hypothetical protein